MTNDRSPNTRSPLEEGRQLLARSREEELTASEEKRLEQLLDAYPKLRAEQKKLGETEELVAQAAPESFAPFFSSRVMSRIERRYGEEQAFAQNLAFYFRRLALAVLLLAAGLITYNTTTAPPSAKNSLVEQVTGIPSATLEDAYSLNLYDAP